MLQKKINSFIDRIFSSDAERKRLIEKAERSHKLALVAFICLFISGLLTGFKGNLALVFAASLCAVVFAMETSRLYILKVVDRLEERKGKVEPVGAGQHR